MTRFPDKLLLGLAYFLVTAVLLLPVWLVDMVPMPDFASHMARIHVLSSLETNSVLATMYEAKWDFLPNIAMDVIVLAAAKALPLIIAGKLFISVCVLLWIAGTAWLHRALSGRWSFIPLFAAPFVLNVCFYLGFLNFLFAAGVAIAGFAAWVAMSSWALLARVICFLPITLVAYFSHVMGFAILACCVLGFEIGLELTEPRISWRKGMRRLFSAALPLLPALAIFIFLSPHDEHGSGFDFGDIWGAYTRIKYASFLTYDQPYFLALAFLVLICGIGLFTRTLTIDRRLWPVLIGLGFAALFAPVKMIGAAFVQVRLPAVLCCLGIASLNDRIGRAPKALSVSLLMVLLIYRAVITSQTWERFDRDYADLAAAIGTIESGSKIFLAQAYEGSARDREILTVYSHYLDLMSVERNIFAPLIFAWSGQHPLRATPAYIPFGANSSHQGIPVMADYLPVLARGDSGGVSARFPYLVRWQCKFDYVVVVHIADGINPAPHFLAAQRGGTFFTLFKVVRSNEACG